MAKVKTSRKFATPPDVLVANGKNSVTNATVFGAISSHGHVGASDSLVPSILAENTTRQHTETLMDGGYFFSGLNLIALWNTREGIFKVSWSDSNEFMSNNLRVSLAVLLYSATLKIGAQCVLVSRHPGFSDCLWNRINNRGCWESTLPCVERVINP